MAQLVLLAHIIHGMRGAALAAPPAVEIALMHAGLNLGLPLGCQAAEPFLLKKGYRVNVRA